MNRRKQYTKGRSNRRQRRRPKKNTSVYRDVGNLGAIRSTQVMIAPQFRTRLIHDTSTQIPLTAVQGGVARYLLNSLHHLQTGGTNKVIPNLGNYMNIYSSARVMGAHVSATFVSNDVNPAHVRCGITNQDPGPTFSNYFSIEGNPRCRKGTLGPVGTPNVTLYCTSNFQKLVGGKFIATDDAYITNQSTDPVDVIYYWVEADNLNGTAFTATKGPNVSITFSLDVVFFGLQIQIN